MTRIQPPHPRRVVLIGAARSGTKILRDSLAEAAGAGAVPYDIGYVWRAGGLDHPDDVLDPDSLKPGVRDFIARFVDRYAEGHPPAVIEKSVGNTMRVPFVSAVLPDAIYVHLIRDGVDVVESTRRQWKASPDYRYLAGKLRHFPLRMAPTYGRRYAGSLLRRKVAGDRRVATWGPRYPGIDVDLANGELLTVCARQWRQSVERARHDLATAGLAAIEVRYESLVADPAAQLARIIDFCGLQTTTRSLNAASANIVPGRTGQGSQALRTYELAALAEEIGDLLADLGYNRPGCGGGENGETTRK